ncbi:MAG TPA: hypothetical protein PKH95_00430 [Candidatus Magasanikbacteria bacterium]|nr:hypothetical protein [Candidatus Magasanikbacteria bacterium]
MKKIIIFTVLSLSLFLGASTVYANMPMCGYNGDLCGSGNPIIDFFHERSVFDFSVLGHDVLILLINACLEICLWYLLFAKKLLQPIKSKLLMAVFIVNIVSWYITFAQSFGINMYNILSYFLFRSNVFPEMFVILFESIILTLIFRKNIRIKTIWIMTIFANLVSWLVGLMVGIYFI